MRPDRTTVVEGRLAARAAVAADQLRARSLPWWSRRIDVRHGGYLLSESEKQLATQSRMVWTFAHSHRKRFGDYLPAAEQGLAFLLKRFRDPRHGGFYWKTDLAGRVLDDRKILYGHLFVVYALVEYARASGNRDALVEALSLLDLLGRRAHDDRHGGWLEHFRRSWRPIRWRRRGAEVEVPGRKSANTHLHAVEALAELCTDARDLESEALLRETVEVCTSYFYPEDPRAASRRRSRDWSSPDRPEPSVGHNVEFARLLLRADDVLRREPRWSRFDAYLSHALTAPRPERVWWVEAELLAALTVGAARDNRYAAPLEDLLAFLLAHQIDPVDGVWLDTVADDGRPLKPIKVGTWKDAYHDVRAGVLLAEAFGGRQGAV